MRYSVSQVGIELEGFAYRPNGQMADILGHLGAPDVTIPNVGKVDADAGIHQLEVALVPVDVADIDRIPGMIRQGLAVFPSEWRLHFCGTDPHRPYGTPPAPWAPSAIDAAWLDANSREHGTTNGLRELSRYSSLQIHLPVDLDSVVGLRILNGLQMLSPALGAWFTPGPGPSTRLQRVYQGWQHPRRSPGNWWFPTTEELRAFWRSLPRLLHKGADETYVVALDDPDTFPDRLREWSVSWFVRPRWSQGTLEIRPLDSQEPERIPAIVRYLVELAEVLAQVPLSRHGQSPIANHDWWAMLATQDRFTAAQWLSEFVPPPVWRDGDDALIAAAASGKVIAINR